MSSWKGIQKHFAEPYPQHCRHRSRTPPSYWMACSSCNQLRCHITAPLQTTSASWCWDGFCLCSPLPTTSTCYLTTLDATEPVQKMSSKVAEMQLLSRCQARVTTKPWHWSVSAPNSATGDIFLRAETARALLYASLPGAVLLSCTAKHFKMGNLIWLQESLMARIGTKLVRSPPHSNQSKWNNLKQTTKRRTPVFGPMHFSTRLHLSTVQTQTPFWSCSHFWMYTQLRSLSAWTCLALLIVCTSTCTPCTKAHNMIQIFLLCLQSCVHPPHKQRMSCRSVTIHHFWQDSASPLSLMVFFASPVSSVSRSGTQATTSPTVSCWHGLSHAHTTWSTSPSSTLHRRIFSQSCEMKSATVKLSTKISSVVWEEQYGEPSARKKTLCPPFQLWCSISCVVIGCWRCGV